MSIFDVLTMIGGLCLFLFGMILLGFATNDLQTALQVEPLEQVSCSIETV